MPALRAQWPLQAALLGACLLLGILAGLAPAAAVGVSVGLAFLLLVAADLTFGVCLFVLVAFAARLPALGGSDITLVKLLGGVLALSWLATVAQPRSDRRQLFADRPGLLALAVLLLAWIALSVLWAEDVAAAQLDVMRYALNLTLLPIVYTAVRDRRDVIAILATYLAGAVLSALYAIATRPTGEELERIGGVAGTANQLASALVTALLLGGALAIAFWRSPGPRALVLAGMAICLVGIFMTLSRAGLLALAAALLASVVLAGRWRAGAAIALVAVGLAAFGYFSFAVPDAARERVTSLGSGTGRTDLWTVAERMVSAEPVTGVGVGNFRTSSIHYLLTEPGLIRRDDFFIERPQVAHNMYLQIAAELGLPGLLLFAALLLGCLTCAFKAAGAFRRQGDRAMEACARGVVLALVGLLVADAFASDQLAKELWLLLALGPALLSLASRPATPA
jgi:O-antigen ligase